MADFESEQDDFVAATAQLDIFATSGAEAYVRFRAFVAKALALLPEHRELPFSQWLAISNRAVRGEATADELAAARRSVQAYRQRECAPESFDPPWTSRRHALSVLFWFSLEDWPSKPGTRTRTSIVQDIDEFASLFIEFHGQGQALVRLLKESFGIE